MGKWETEKLQAMHRHKPTMNSGPGIAKPREVEGIALS